jgi:hypothetical protein
MKVTTSNLTEKDVLARCRDVAKELRDHAFLLADKCTAGGSSHTREWRTTSLDAGSLSERLISLASSLTEIASYLDERHSNG